MWGTTKLQWFIAGILVCYELLKVAKKNGWLTMTMRDDGKKNGWPKPKKNVAWWGKAWWKPKPGWTGK